MRFVQVAKGLGGNAFLQSICQDDFGPTSDVLVERLTQDSGASCVLQPIERRSDGTIDCEVIWELPEPGSAPDAPSACAERPFLRRVDAQRPARNPRGGVNCALAFTAAAQPPQGVEILLDCAR